MSFAHPLALLLLLLLIPVALLYWLRRSRAAGGSSARGRSGSKALAEETFRARWQRWRTPSRWPLQMLDRRACSPGRGGAGRFRRRSGSCSILDNSATMRATDVQPSRLDAAKEAARRLIESLRWCDEMAVVATSPQPAEVQPLTSDHALLADGIDSCRLRGEPPSIEWAVKMAREITLG